MRRRSTLAIRMTVVLICIFIPTTKSAEISIGVEEGDWIEYEITYTGTPPEKHPTWARIEILNVQGASIALNDTVKYSDGTQHTVNVTVNLEIGQLGDGLIIPDDACMYALIIPANLDSGDTFFEVGAWRQFYRKIIGVEERAYAGARRAVVNATCVHPWGQDIFYWDKPTGVLVEANLDFYPIYRYTENIKADKTNMWQAQIFELEPIVFYTLIIVAMGLGAIIATFFVVRRRKNLPEEIVSFQPLTLTGYRYS